MAQRQKATAAGIKIKPAGEMYRPSDVRERRDMIKNFLAVPSHMNEVNEKLFKVLAADTSLTSYSADEARRFVHDFLLPEINKDRDEAVQAKTQLKKRPAGADIDKDDTFWKQEIEAGLKDAGMKPTKNTKDQLPVYLKNVLGRVQAVTDQALNANPAL